MKQKGKLLDQNNQYCSQVIWKMISLEIFLFKYKKLSFFDLFFQDIQQILSNLIFKYKNTIYNLCQQTWIAIELKYKFQFGSVCSFFLNSSKYQNIELQYIRFQHRVLKNQLCICKVFFIFGYLSDVELILIKFLKNGLKLQIKIRYLKYSLFSLLI
ncbi:hypothetical protein pb186bvf_020944 [Paramecium bursaria]